MTDSQKLHFGIKTTQYFSYEDILRVWQEAETLPSIEHAWLFDHPMPIMRADPSGPCLDGWTLLAALAAQTKRLRLGLMVASNANQTPALLAKRAATLDIILHGRLEFGLGEACEIIRRMWTEPVVNFEGRYYHLSETYCEPKPVQKPTPPFVIGGVGEQLTLRVVAQYADVWNYPRYPLGTVEEFQQKNRVLDGYCAAIERDPATLARSVQFIINPRENPASTRQTVQDFIVAGATHLVLGPRVLDEGIAHWLSEEIIEPLREASHTQPH